MMKDKQIEIPESEMGMSGYTKLAWELWHKADLSMVKCIEVDRIVRTQGYRKASDVALEVIDEIERATINHRTAISGLEPQNDYCAGGKKALDMTLKVLSVLKKKYIGEDTNVLAKTEGCDG